jgi:hypothetical protein
MIEPGAVAEEGLGVTVLAAGASSSLAASLFADGELNQWLVAAIAFRTAWRPLSSTLPPAAAAPSEWPSPSADSAADPDPAADPAAE